jgi:hypothetical protein
MDSQNTQTIIAIILIVLTLILLGIWIYITFRGNPTTGSSTGGVGASGTTGAIGSPGLPGIFQPCNFDNNNRNVNSLGSTGICATGLICGVNNLCVADLGTPCSSFFQCTPESNTCSGKCAFGPVGGLNQFCPCRQNLGLECVTLASGYQTCVYRNGFPCTVDTECVNRCINNVCSGGLSIGSPCSAGQCIAPYECNAQNYCQLPNVQNGSQNAYCNDTNPALFCFAPLSCTDNECTSTSSGLGTVCSNSVCNLPLQCKQQPAVPPGTTGGFQICVFPDNNTCTTNCAPGFVCDLNSNKCIASVGQSCVTDNNCSSDVCNVNSTLLYWTGTKWLNLGTAPTDTFSRLIVEYRTGTSVSNVYLLGTAGLHHYNFGTNTWSLTISSPTPLGPIIDSCIDFGNKVWLLIDTGTSVGPVVVDTNLVPTTQFGTPNGNLIIAGNVIPLSTIDINVNNKIVSSDANGKVYINTVQQTLPPSIGARKARAFGNYPPVDNFAYIHFLVNTVGQLNNNTFPLFTDNGTPFINVTDYSIYVVNSITVPTSVDAANSFIYMIATTDNVNYQIIVNSGAYQSSIPGYVDNTSLIGNNGPDLFLYSTHACV